MGANTYNKRQAEHYGWTPAWFGAQGFGDELTDAVEEFQRENGLNVDGYAGPSTYRRLWTQRQSEGDFVPDPGLEPGERYIVHNGRAVEIQWPKVVLWTEGKKRHASRYADRSGRPDRKPTMFMTHWDVCLSSASCFSVLEKRNLSVHFGLDNDGCIHQWLDTQHVAYHAGRLNVCSIGVEVSSAYSLKYQSWYERNAFGKRPIWTDVKVHGKTLSPFLGFYDHQIEALAALWEAVSHATGIPLELPATENAVDPAVQDRSFSGFCNHYHATARKIDAAGMDNDLVLTKALLLRQKR